MKKQRFNKQDLLLLGLLAALAVLACAIVLAAPPGSPRAKWLPKCMVYQQTGLYCPGCGCTRALSALLHGDLKASLHNNLLLIPGSLLVALLIAKPQITLRRPVAITIVVIIVTFTVLRNIPCAPFTALAPIPLP